MTSRALNIMAMAMADGEDAEPDGEIGALVILLGKDLLGGSEIADEGGRR